jgi:outer membrane biosynthesis protein TonB
MRAVQFPLSILGAVVVAALAGSAKADRRPQDAGPPPPAPSPIIVRSGALAGPVPSVENTILQTPQAEATCAGAPVQPLYADDLPVETRFDRDADRPHAVLGFTIAEDGRTRDIRRLTPSVQDAVMVSGATVADQHQAALSAWRFPAGARSDCRLTIRYRATPLAEATQDDLLRYFAVTRTNGPLRRAVASRLAGPEANCGGPERSGGRPPRTVSYPDNKIGRRPPPGGRSWTVLRWNIDAEGRATAVETLGSSGDVDFDAETRRAVSETVVQPGPPQKGCVYNFYRIGPALLAPALPPSADDPLQVCPPEVEDRFHAQGQPRTYPRAFGNRAIEGWALVRFDTATWGQVGNVAVIDAQPAEAFGEAGRRTVQSGRADPGFAAGVRCVVPVRYRMPESVGANATSDDAPDGVPGDDIVLH